MKKNYNLKNYIPFALNVFQRRLSYRSDVIIFILGQTMMLAVTYYLWKAIYGSSPNNIINEFSLNEIIIYILISTITSIIINPDIGVDIYREVKDGSIAINLIKPISYEKRMIFQGLGNVMYNFIVVFIGSFIITTVINYNLVGSLSLYNITFYFISLILGIFINLYYSYIFALFTFKLTNMWGLYQITSAISLLLSGTLIPITFFPKGLQWIFNFLPFSSMIYTPTMIYLGKLEQMKLFESIIIQVAWLIIMIVLAKVIWKIMIKQLTILGG